jgi:hypothetical protein
MTRPDTKSSIESSESLLLELLVDRLLLDQRFGRRCPLNPGGGRESS